MLGMDVRIVAPRSLWPSDSIVTQAKSYAAESGSRVTLTEDVAQGSRASTSSTPTSGCRWVAEEVWADRIELLSPYQVNAELLQLTGNPQIRFMHCLPAFHDLETQVGRDVHEQFGLKELEVTDDVFESQASIVFDQAENRLHTIKALLVATLVQL